MSKFSDKIQTIIQESGYTVYQISRGSGLGRTSIHKMMSGTLIPGRDFMNQFYDYMRVGPVERQELEYYYMIEKDGWERYENRMFIKEMLEGVSDRYEEGVANDLMDVQNWEEDYSNSEQASNLYQTLNLVHRILCKEWNNYDQPRLDMNIPLSSKYLVQMIYQLYREKGKHVKVRQVVIMNQNPSRLKDANYNLKILHRILPLSLSFPNQYQVRRCYSKCEEKDSYAFFWPYYMITHDYVIMISYDGSSAYLQKEPGIVRKYQEAFQALFEDSALFLEQYHDPMEAMKNYLKNYEEYGIPDYTLEHKPCLDHMFTDGTLKSMMGSKAEEFPELFQLLHDFYIRSGQNPKKPIGFFSQSGLEDFKKTGRLFENTGIFPHGFEEDKRTAMLKTFLERSRQMNIESHMILDRRMKIPSNLMIEAFGARKLLLFHSASPTDLNFIQITESSICEGFLDFMEYLAESDMALSTEDTLKHIEGMLD